MIATENFDVKSDKNETSNEPSYETKKAESCETNVKSSNSSSVPSISSSSFNSFANSPNTSTSSSPTNNKDNTNYKKKMSRINTNQNYNDPLLNCYQPNYGFYPPSMFGFENIPLNDPLVNQYYEYAQQLFGYSNYPTYFPADFSQTWNSNTTKNYNNDGKKRDNKNTSNEEQKNKNNSSSNNYQRKYKKPFGKRDENQKQEEVKPKIPDYDLMKSEQVYVDAYPALPSASTNDIKVSNTNEEKIPEVKPTEITEAKTETINSTKSTDNSQLSWSGKRWSEIVHGNKVFFNEPVQNNQKPLQQVQNTDKVQNKENDNDKENLEKVLDGLNLGDTDTKVNTNINDQNGNKKFDKSYPKKSNYKKDKYYQNYYYPTMNNNFDYLLQQQFYNDYKTYCTPNLDFDKSILDELNPVEFLYNGEKEGAKESKFFVIKSNSREDVLHSIKHSIWCSTKYGNTKLNQAFAEKQNSKHMSIYLFFSVNTSGMFSGMAEMVSHVDFDSKSDLWTQDKWKGKFDIKWIYVKDVPNSKLKHITLPNNENKPVTHSRDAQEIPFDKGAEMLDIFRTYKHTSTLFDNSIDLYQAENYMYNLMMNYYNTQNTNQKYSKYHYRSSDYKWKNKEANNAQKDESKRPMSETTGAN